MTLMTKYITVRIIIKVEDQFIEEFNCTLPWMRTKKIVNICSLYETGNVSFGTIGEKVNRWMDIWYYYECSVHGTKCSNTILNLKTTGFNKDNTNVSKVYISLESEFVQNIIDSYAYDLQSLIGEVGGTLGPFLGLSTYSVVEFVTFIIEKITCS